MYVVSLHIESTDSMIDMTVSPAGFVVATQQFYTTVKPPNKGHFGNNINSSLLSLICIEVVLFSNVLEPLVLPKFVGLGAKGKLCIEHIGEAMA